MTVTRATILDEILAQKQVEIAAAQARRPLSELRVAARQQTPPRDFVAALRKASWMGLIAEVKRASPSAGVIRADFDPVAIARAYVAGGAHCLSVLTDEKFFHGHLDYLRAIRDAVTVPLLRKEFVIDEYQVWEARAAGADAVLLIAECLDDEQLPALDRSIRELGMTPLIEIYDPENLPRVLALSPALLGINNRDLRSFAVDLQHTVRLAAKVPRSTLLVSESGIKSRADVEQVHAAGARAILVGETLMRAGDIAAGIASLTASPDALSRAARAHAATADAP